MLILTRKIGESLIIGDGEVRIAVLGVRGHQVRLGVTAPRNVAVHRDEIYQRIHDTDNPQEPGDNKSQETE